MKKLFALFLIGTLILVFQCSPPENGTDAITSFQVPVDYYKLDNGLKVILSPDNTSPTVVVAVYYNIGFRIEPKDRTGFAHLFEHMMFQGTPTFPKGEFDKLTTRNGGVNNGSTRFDFTNYFEIVPSHMLEPFLWAEADRMKHLDLSPENLKNQQDVVKNEVKVNVLNQPYGGFPWLDMPQYANENWYNAHNFYGDLEDLDAANLEDVKTFFDTFYAPNNAALAIVGDFDPQQAKEWIQQYFGALPSSELPEIPDVSEQRQEEEKRFEKEDKLATKPALAIAYKMPERNTREYYAMGLLDQILVQGDNSLLHKSLVKENGYTAGVGGGINYLGDMFNYNGPMLWMFNLTHDGEVSADSIIASVDQVMMDLQTNGVTQKMLDNAMIKIRSSIYDKAGGFFGMGKADLLCSFALFDDDPSRINNLEEGFKQVTKEDISRTISEYLRSTNRTVLALKPTADQN